MLTTESLDDLITLEEAGLALMNMKNKKSYSPEGFIVNFFKFFFVDIGTFLVRSSNEGFKKKSFIRLTKARQNYLRA